MTTPEPTDPAEPQPLETTAAAVAFVVAVLGAVGFVLAYVLLDNGTLQTQALGGSMLLAFAGLGTGLVMWSQSAMPQGPDVEPRGAPTSQPATRAAAGDAVAAGVEHVGRRSLLGRLLAAALGTVGLASLAPLASLRPRPRPDETATGWAAGRRLVREDDSPVHRDDVPVGGAIPAFPRGAQQLAASQVMLVHVAPEGQLELTSARREWTVAGFVAYSRLCTHMGCSVGLYQTETRSLVCPCHQSAFQVMDGGSPQFGPATRPLPQLPLGLDDEGFLIATGDFERPVGTARWDYPSKVEESA